MDFCGAGSWAGEVTDTLYFLRREEAGGTSTLSSARTAAVACLQVPCPVCVAASSESLAPGSWQRLMTCTQITIANNSSSKLTNFMSVTVLRTYGCSYLIVTIASMIFPFYRRVNRS